MKREIFVSFFGSKLTEAQSIALGLALKLSIEYNDGDPKHFVRNVLHYCSPVDIGNFANECGKQGINLLFEE